MATPPDQVGATTIGPVELGEPQNPLAAHRFAGLPAGEREIWARALEVLRPRYDRLYYNVHLGAWTQFTAGLTQPIVRDQASLLAHKIDVVGDARDHWEILEVKDRASLSLAGQLLGYRILWRLGPPDDRPVRLVAVMPNVTPPIGHILAELGIELAIG